MAIDRNRISQQAEKLVVQGKIDAAIAHLEQLVRDNPRDMNTINRIGDLYSRLGKRREAILQFNKIGDFYAKDGFFLKAIAIYKKITKLDPSHLDSHQRLADLYAQQGLVLEARSGYQAVAEQYLRAGDLKKAIAASQALVRLDPENLRARGVLAELMTRDGRQAEAVEEYLKIGGELERRGLSDEAQGMYEKAAAAQPGSPALVARLAEGKVAAGDVKGGIKLVQDALKKPGDHTDLLVLLGTLRLKAGQHAEAKEALMRAAALAPARGEIRVQLARVHLAQGDAAAAFEVIGAQAGHLVKEGRGPETVQLLEEILALDEGNRDVHRRLTEIYSALKDEANTVRCMDRLLDLCMDAREYDEARRIAEGLLKLRPNDPAIREKTEQARNAGRTGSARPAEGERGEAPPVEPGAAAELDLPPPPDLEADDEDFITEHMTEADVFVKYGLADRAVEQLAAIVERFPGHAAAHARLKEIYLEEGNREAARAEMVALVKAHLAGEDAVAAHEALAELKRFDPACSEAAGLEKAMAASYIPAEAGAMTVVTGRGMEAVASADFSPMEDPVEEALLDTDEASPTEEVLSQVDGHLAQGRREEAVGILRKLAETFGSHPALVSRMKKALSTPAAAPAAPAARAKPAAVPAPVEEAAEEFDITEGEEPQAPPAAGEGLEDLMDLAAEIDSALGGSSEADAALLAGVEAAPEGHSLEEIVQAFKKGIEQQVDADDFDTHYNLGIAYKEMGLMDEAIGEFQFASRDQRLLVDCCSMLGICFKEKGMSPLAVKWYRKGLEAASGREEEALLGLRYDLADLLAEMGEQREAMDLFTEVFGINSKYRDVAARIKQLEKGR